MTRGFLLSIAGLLAITSGLMVSTLAFAGQWNNYHWPSSNFDLDVKDRTSSEYEINGPLGVVADWNGALPGGGPQMTINGGADIEIRSKNGNAFYLGIAEILVNTSTGHILEGRVTLNHRYLKENNLYGYTADDRKHVACQEIGHVLGLDHQLGQSCMNDDLGKLGNYTTWDQEDKNTLNDMYAPHDDGVPAPPPPDDGGGDNGGPPCSKNPNHPNCVPQGAVWITVHVIPAPQR